jgi:hypothetical protein
LKDSAIGFFTQVLDLALFEFGAAILTGTVPFKSMTIRLLPRIPAN